MEIEICKDCKIKRIEEDDFRRLETDKEPCRACKHWVEELFE
jgi:hypothetical protein